MDPETSMRKKLLIIEDDASVLASLNLCLKSHYEICSASTIGLGFKAFKKHRPSLVLLDLRLSDGSGLDVLRKIRAVDVAVPVIVLTGYASMDTVEEALRLGASDYLHKPFNASTLRTRIDEVIVSKQLKKKSMNSESGDGNSFSSLDPAKIHQLGITRREADVLQWIIQGKRDSEIAAILSISIRTVHHHVASILNKLGVETRTAAATAISNGQVDSQ